MEGMQVSEPSLPVVGGPGTPDTVVLPIPRAGNAVRLANWRGYYPQIKVNGKNVGNRKGAKITFSSGETAKVTIKALIPGKPRVFVDGVEVFTTPQPPVWLVVMAALPALSLIVLRGVGGLGIAFGAVLAAVAVAARESLSVMTRALAISGIVVAAWSIAVLAVILAR